MQKLLSVIIAVILSLFFFGCSAPSNEEENDRFRADHPVFEEVEDEQSADDSTPETGPEEELPPSLSDEGTLLEYLRFDFRLDASVPESLSGSEEDLDAGKGELTTWIDISGQGVDMGFSENRGATRPQWVRANSRGLPAARFDGDRNTLRAHGSSPRILSSASSSGWTIAVVASYDHDQARRMKKGRAQKVSSVLFSYGGDANYKRIQAEFDSEKSSIDLMGVSLEIPLEAFSLEEGRPFVLIVTDEFGLEDSVARAFVNGLPIAEKRSSESRVVASGESFQPLPHQGYSIGSPLFHTPLPGLMITRIDHSPMARGRMGPFTLGQKSKTSAPGQGWSGDIHEVIIIRSNLRVAQVRELSRSLYQKWVSGSGTRH